VATRQSDFDGMFRRMDGSAPQSPAPKPDDFGDMFGRMDRNEFAAPSAPQPLIATPDSLGKIGSGLLNGGLHLGKSDDFDSMFQGMDKQSKPDDFESMFARMDGPPKTSVNINEDADFSKEDFAGAQPYPDAQPEPVKMDVGQAIANYFHNRARPDLPEMPKGYGQELSKAVQVKVPTPKGRYPTPDEVDDAVMSAMGGEPYVRAARQYRKEAGEPLGQAQFDVASAFQSGDAGYVEDGKGGGYYTFNVQPKQRLIKALNTYLQTGDVNKVREVDRQIADADEKFNKEYLTVRQKAESERGVLDAVGTGADEVAAKAGQLLHNVGAVGKGAYTRARYGRDSAEMDRLIEEDRNAQGVVDSAEAAIPPEKTLANKIARGTTEMAGDVATKGWMGPAFPAGVFAENLQRGPMEATRRAVPTVPMVMAGQVVGKLADGLTPAARQVVTRGAMAATNAGTAALGGERDPAKLGLAAGMGAMMPVGKAESEGPATARPLEDAPVTPSMARGQFTHPDLGELTATVDQSGVRPGWVRVMNEDSPAPFVVRRPNPENVGGVRYADGSSNPNAAPAGRVPTTTEKVSNVLNVARGAQTSLDTHSLFRQAAISFGANPIRTMRAYFQSLPSIWSEEYAGKMLNDIQNSPRAAQMKDSGLYLADYLPKAEPLTAREENLMSNLLHKIPGVSGGRQRQYVVLLRQGENLMPIQCLC
jgi:hypothetical protein